MSRNSYDMDDSTRNENAGNNSQNRSQNNSQNNGQKQQPGLQKLRLMA